LQKKIELDREHQARKSRGPKTTRSQAAPAEASKQLRAGTDDIEEDEVEQITLDDMFVIDSAGEYSVSGDDSDAPAANDVAAKDGRTTTSDATHRQDFKLFLSYLRSVDCNFRKAVSTF